MKLAPREFSRCYDIKSSIHLAGCRGKKEGKTPTLALVLYIAVSFLPKFPFIWSVFDNNLRLGIFRIVYEPSSHIAIQVRPQSDISTTGVSGVLQSPFGLAEITRPQKLFLKSFKEIKISLRMREEYPTSIT